MPHHSESRADLKAPPAPAVVDLRFFPASAILSCVADTLGTTVADLHGPRVVAGLNAARQVSALLLAEFTMLSNVEIGHALGRRDDSSGGHIVKVGRARLEKDQVFRCALQQARERLLEGLHV